MALTDPIDPHATEAADSTFEIEQGHFGPHLPRPNWEVVCAVGGALLLLIGSYLPWFTITQQGFDQGTNGPGAPTTRTIQFGGWGAIFSHAPGTQSISTNGGGFAILVAFPAVVGLLAFAMNILWYRRRANTLSCGVGISALLMGFGLLFAETVILLMIIVLYTGFGFNSALSVQVGLSFPLMYVGYFGLAAATFAMCVGYWRGARSAH